jgi:hypothetical protein
VRDRALLMVLYNTGGRVSEIVGLTLEDLRLHGTCAQVKLLGKGRKPRSCPLWSETARKEQTLFQRPHNNAQNAAVHQSWNRLGHLPDQIQLLSGDCCIRTHQSRTNDIMWNPEKYIKAWNFASVAHNGQMVPGTDIPYIHHIGLVAMEAMSAITYDSTIEKPDLLIQCALLHDVIEDTSGTYDALRAEFGAQVEDGVLA